MPLRRPESVIVPSRRRAAPHARGGALVQPLESRRLMSTGVEFLGEELRVGGPVVRGAFERQSIDYDAAGNYVVAWTGNDLSSDPDDRFGVQARRYRADGTPLGDAFVVNSHTANDQWQPTVAVDADGDFVVSFMSNVEGNGQTDVYARRFDRNGVPLGNDFVVNQTTSRTQHNPSVATDAAGNFVVTWVDMEQQTAAGFGIMLRRYNAAGVALGDETLVGRTHLTGDPSLAMQPGGQFILAWDNRVVTPGNTFSSSEIFARRFDASAAPLGPEFRVNGSTAFTQEDPRVAVNSSGAFAVVWTEQAHGADFPDRPFIRTFDASGAPRRREIPASLLASAARTNQFMPAVAIDDAGRSLVTWVTGDPTTGDASGTVVIARSFDATGVPATDQFRVNTTTAGDQTVPAVALTAAGEGAVVWMAAAFNMPEAQSGVFAQRVRLVDVAPTAASVADRHVFYNRSRFDGVTPGAPPMIDDLAIAPDKEALLPGQTTSLENVTSYSNGINGVMIDVADLAGAGDYLTAADLVFEAGPGRGPTPWAPAPAPSEFALRRNAGVGGSDRIVITWPDGALTNTWLKVTLPAGELTGLARPDVFYFANVVGDTGVDGRGEPNVDVFDMTRVARATRRMRSEVPITDPYDFNRDGVVSSRDRDLARANQGTSLAALTPPREAPAAPPRAAGGAAEILSANRRRTAYRPASML